MGKRRKRAKPAPVWLLVVAATMVTVLVALALFLYVIPLFGEASDVAIVMGVVLSAVGTLVIGFVWTRLVQYLESKEKN